MSEWISAKGVLPKNYGTSRSRAVIVYCPETKCQYTAFYDRSLDSWIHFAVSAGGVLHDVSHWMPLPPNPEEE